MSAALLFAAALSVGSPALHIVSSSVAADFARALRIERPELRLTAKDEANFSAQLEREPGQFSIRIEDLDAGRARLERNIPLGGETEAAMRVAVLLTLSVIDHGVADTTTTTALAETSTSTVVVMRSSAETAVPSNLSFHVAAGAGIWLDQPGPQLTFAAGFLGRWSWLRAGIEVGVHGVGCCDRENETIVSSWTELTMGGVIGATFLELEALRLAFDLGAGLLAVLGQAAPADMVFASAGQPASIDHLGLELRAAVEAELLLSDRLALLARAGLRLSPIQQTIVLPQAFQGLGEPLTSPWGAPFLQLGLRFFFF